MRRQQAAFTLIEMMITIVVLAILAAIALPSYSKYMLRTHRAEGIALLNEAAAREERYYAQNNSYVVADSELSSLGLRNSGASDNGYYQLTLAEGGDDDAGYRLTATAQNAQSSDSDCGNLTLNGAGERSVSGSSAVSDCWK
ncbi:pilus assembly protein PilE [Pseudomonas alcaligenes]|uniref:Pilus assembly protein PilE n=1 Tax=Aquipseudomonas alcaligenes TaxID=43263 RepID=A0ABR7S4I6_AQUAC|nr:type IV pilin protein [Pseudomonas alcaligenes]MBC9252492.1 pilus assembly protein PilE [Pseudomonas alcaligenes]